MEFGQMCFHGCYHSYSLFPFELENALLFILVSFTLGSPAGILWVVRIIYRWNIPWFEGRDITHLEFPERPILPPPQHYEPSHVEMLVGSCSEAKRCAYCHEEFENDSTRRFCFSCGSAAHEECEVLNGGCSLYGCAAKAVS